MTSEYKIMEKTFLANSRIWVHGAGVKSLLSFNSPSEMRDSLRTRAWEWMLWLRAPREHWVTTWDGKKFNEDTKGWKFDCLALAISAEGTCTGATATGGGAASRGFGLDFLEEPAAACDSEAFLLPRLPFSGFATVGSGVVWNNWEVGMKPQELLKFWVSLNPVLIPSAHKILGNIHRSAMVISNGNIETSITTPIARPKILLKPLYVRLKNRPD